MEARAGIEPAYAELQSATSPLCHRANDLVFIMRFVKNLHVNCTISVIINTNHIYPCFIFMKNYHCSILKILCCVMFLACLPITLSNAQGVGKNNEPVVRDLETAIGLAINENPTLKAFSWNIDLAQENVDLAEADNRPFVNLTGDMAHTRSDNNIAEEWSGETSQSIGLNVSQSLYTGGATEAEIRQKRLLKAATEGEMASLVQNTIVDVVEAYMATHQSLRAKQVNMDNVDLLTKQLRATTARFEAGELTRTDTSQARARLAEAEASLAEAEAIHEVALSQLREIIGDVMVANLAYPDIEQGRLPQSVQQAVDYGLEYNPSILVAKRNIVASDFGIKSQKGEFMPQLSANAGLGYDRNPAFSQFDRQETAVVSLNATLPLYQGGVLRNNLRQAKIRKAQAQDDFLAVKRAVTNQVVSAWEEYQAVQSQIAARESQRDAAEIAYEGVRLEEEVGARSILDVLDANQELRDAELALIDAKREKVNAYYGLLASMGVLNETFWDKSETRL